MHKAKSQITHYHFDIYLYDYFLIMQTFLVDVTSWSSSHTKLTPVSLLHIFWLCFGLKTGSLQLFPVSQARVTALYVVTWQNIDGVTCHAGHTGLVTCVTYCPVTWGQTPQCHTELTPHYSTYSIPKHIHVIHIDWLQVLNPLCRSTINN